MSDYVKKIVYLSQEQYETLIENRTITIDGKTVVYDANDIYITPQATPLYPVAGAINGNFAALDSNGEVVDSGHAHGEYAAKQDTVLETSLSRGRKENTTIGIGSVAFGDNVEASGEYSFAVGHNTIASGAHSKAEGYGATASGNNSHAEGNGVIANGTNVHAEGKYNVEQTIFPTWVANTHYYPGDGVYHIPTYYICLEENTDSVWTSSHWRQYGFSSNIAFTIGNGLNNSNRSNAYALDWDGNGHFMGDVYVGANADSSGGTKLAKLSDIAVNDVQIAGTSIVSSGVANVPIADTSNAGVVIIGSGLTLNTSNKLSTNAAGTGTIKQGTNANQPIVPGKQHEATFYGLSKVAGVDLANETVTLGTYPETSKAAIRFLIGAENGDDIVKVQDTQPTTPATKIWMPETPPASVQVPTVGEMESALAGKVSDVQVNGTSVVSNGVANVPVATSNDFGVVKVGPGLQIGSSNELKTVPASTNNIKVGIEASKPITPVRQHESTFYGLAKAAGDTTQSASSNAVGTYTDNAKAAIKAMLGVVDGVQTITVSGTTPSITAISNARYICGEVSTLDITPPATGICDIVFESGSTPTVLTVPNTVKFPSWFDTTTLEANTTYEINIVDGVYGAVMTWE